MAANQAIKTQGTIFRVSDTTSPDTYLTVGDVQSFAGPGGEAAEIDVTHMLSSAKEFLQGLPDNGSLTISGNFSSTDTGQAELRQARSAQETRSFQLLFVNGAIWTFTGLVYSFSLNGNQDSKWDYTATIRVSGAITES